MPTIGEVISSPSAAAAGGIGRRAGAAAGAAAAAARQAPSRPRSALEVGALLELQVEVLLLEMEVGQPMLVHELDDLADFLEVHGHGKRLAEVLPPGGAA